ncbi:hypothetical protein FACS1894122_09060 [Alphaproteobacteria bacterium]|nr:hypothetical protein FACS1894122_09060 [Alphaproteobacteria bacterium]
MLKVDVEPYIGAGFGKFLVETPLAPDLIEDVLEALTVLKVDVEPYVGAGFGKLLVETLLAPDLIEDALDASSQFIAPLVLKVDNAIVANNIFFIINLIFLKSFLITIQNCKQHHLQVHISPYISRCLRLRKNFVLYIALASLFI